MNELRKRMTIGGIDFDLKLTLIIIMGVLLPMVDYYNHRITGNKAYDRMILYFIIPMAVVLLLFRDRPADYGFQLGNWRVGLMWTVIGCAVMAVILWFIARTPSMQSFYSEKAPDNPLYLIYITAVDLFGWEFMWRGFMLFGMAAVLGPGPAIWLQAVPFAFMHLNKPELEALTTIFGGAAFGYIAWQSGSFLYPFLIHWFIAAFTMLIASGKIG
ncbi:MAG TPA: CPBP family intramembrane glutamic endopeptidase [candidate division Zixibacteria bacterium]|nr:CPBP family intramembrane glutamic endopeptidase [candidate division Zixibacteria bacterium]